ncbi:MAG: xanthine dehydrogenase family protein molybdopterin-binding subunit [Proteobacteria bacterium]|nr:xanthine dehydrogenase family protein molybdopterin-binding subunit [Pseudomonadota bacterium]
MSAHPKDTAPAALDRREFLKASALAGGGLVIGISLAGCGKPADLAKAAGGQPVAWLKIGGDNSITILVDKSEMGQGVYTALPMLIAEELDVPLAAVKVVAAPAGAAYANIFLGTQITGGSTSVREGWQKLRAAGAQARAMLLGAAADEWKVDVGSLKTDAGVVTGPNGQKRTFGELAEAAAKRPLPKDAKPKDASAYKLVGKATPRVDTPSKLDGSAEFGIDVKLPGMKYAALAQSPVLGGKLKSVDSAAAEKLPGVVKVVTTSTGVAVVADHYWQAHVARDALKLSWDEGPNAKLDSAAIRAGLKAAKGTAQSARKDGDAAKALKAAKKKVEASYELPLLAHATMEPMNCTAVVTADRCELYVPTQIQQIAQATAAAAAGLKPEQVSVTTTLLGGGFGRRLEVDFIPAAVEAAKAVGAPVKLIWTREDDMTHDAYRPPAHDSGSAGFDASGALQAVHIQLTSPSVTARMFPPVVEKAVDPFAVEAAANFLYDVPNVSVDYLRHEIGINVGYWRSVSHSLNCFVVESFMDECAHAAGKDPFEFRRALLGKQPRAKRVLEEAAARAGWGKAPAGHHQGIAVMEGYGTYLAQVAEISVEQGKLKVHRIFCAVDCGQRVNPLIVDQQLTGGMVFGLSAALWGEITLAGGKVQQKNFDEYRVVRMNQMPELGVHVLDSSEAPGGIGEPAVALVAPAIANAWFAATGKRVRALPFSASGIA